MEFESRFPLQRLEVYVRQRTDEWDFYMEFELYFNMLDALYQHNIFYIIEGRLLHHCFQSLPVQEKSKQRCLRKRISRLTHSIWRYSDRFYPLLLRHSPHVTNLRDRVRPLPQRFLKERQQHVLCLRAFVYLHICLHW